jgi:hypothetical protein
VLRIVFGLHRLPSLTHEEFRSYWAEQHAPLVARHAAALGIRRYLQLDPVAGPEADVLASSRRAPAPFDGIAELWFDDLGALRSTSAAARAAAVELLEDERRFIDLPTSPIGLFEVREVVPGA